MVLTLLALLVGGILVLPAIADIMMLVVAGLRIRQRSRRDSAAESTNPRLLFLIPAHDEELLLGRCLESIAELDHLEDRLTVTVIADNCSDRTADVARSRDVTCLERHDPTQRGKPFAIDWALRQIDLSCHDGVVILDADSRLDPGYARALSVRAPLGNRVLQGYNDVSNVDDSNLTLMAAVFSAARCVFMNGLKHRAGLNVPLGNGFCIGARILETEGWKAFSVAEDWEMYARLTAGGFRIENQPDARVFSQEARSMQQSTGQRKRWTAGKIEVLIQQFMPMLRSRRIGPLQKLDALAELLAPGPVVLMAVVVLLALAIFLTDPPLTLLTLAILGVSLARLVIYTVLGLTRVRRPGRTLLAFVTLPSYALWRLGVQVAAVAATGRNPWTRTTRHEEPEADPR